MREAPCDRCYRVRWVNTCTQRGVEIGEYCADCFDKVLHDEPARPMPRASSSGPNHNDPGFDNVVRAMEELE